MSVKVLEYDNYEDDFSDFDDGEVREGGLFDADGEEWEWLESESDVVHLDFDNWQVWSASNGPEVAFFVVDVDTGFIDWGPCDTKDEAIEFLDSKEDDWMNESRVTESKYPVYCASAENGPSEDDLYPIDYIKANSKEDAEKIFNKKYKSTRGNKYSLGDPGDTVFEDHGTVTVGIYGDETGKYPDLLSMISAFKKSGIEIIDQDGDEEYGWDLTLKGPAKTLFKMIDGNVPGYNCDDVQDFIDQYSIGEIEEESYSSKTEGVNGSENQMTITVGSHLNSDGFDVSVTDKDGNELFNMDYAYGWDASYDRKLASKDKPYVSDIINELVQEYNVDRSSIKVVNGRNVFNGKDVDKASEFSSKYLECTNTGDISNAPAKHIRMFKDLDKREESIKSEGVKLSSDLMRFYKIIEDLNRYTSKVMTQLRGDSDLKQYAVGAAAVKIGTALDQIAQIRDSMN